MTPEHTKQANAAIAAASNCTMEVCKEVQAARKITTTRIANHLKTSPLGDISMYRNGFFDGAKWAAKKPS